MKGGMNLRCLADEGLSGAGAAAEGGEDRAASDGAADVGDGARPPVTGGGETGGHPAAPAAAPRPGESLPQQTEAHPASVRTSQTAETTVVPNYSLSEFQRESSAWLSFESNPPTQ